MTTRRKVITKKKSKNSKPLKKSEEVNTAEKERILVATDPEVAEEAKHSKSSSSRDIAAKKEKTKDVLLKQSSFD